MKAEEPFQYQPGVCNIDRAGVRTRRMLGIASAVVGVIALVGMNYFLYPMPVRFIIMAGFGFTTAINFIQAREQFCVTNASLGTIEIKGKRTKIRNDEFTRLDKKKRNKMILKALVATMLSGLLGAVSF
jgi:hypothetical protein